MAVALLVSTVAAEPEPEEFVVRGARQPLAPPLVLFRDDPDDLAAGLDDRPGLSLSTNSRGETGLSIRGRSEREPRLWLNGFPVTDPWDDRLNLAVLPGASLAADVSATGGASYGSGAVVRVESMSAPRKRLVLETGDFGFQRGHAAWATDQVNIAVEAQQRDGVRAPGDADLPFSQGPQATRSNTERQQVSALFSGERDYRELRFQGLLLASSSSYGVAPEGHLDPAVSRVRYWQVPEDERLFLGGGLNRKIGDRTIDLRSWLHRTEKKTDAFEDASYDVLTGREDTKSRGYGVNLAIVGGIASAGVSWGGLRHHAQDDDEPTEVFSRQTYSVWGEVGHDVMDDVRVSGDLRTEGFITEDTGGRESGPDLNIVTGRLQIEKRVTPTFHWSVTSARLGRLPSQRELYGEALGRFLVNPDLKAERAWSGSADLVWDDSQFRVEVTPFVEKWGQLIDQQVVGVLRQRMNSDGYWAYGVEARASAELTDQLSGDVRLTLVDLRVVGETPFLTERPERQLGATLIYQPRERWRGRMRLRHQGGAFSLGERGERVPLPAATSFDLEVAASVHSQIWAYVHVDNALDAEFVPQLGLPDPGRMVRIGIRLQR